MAPRMPVFGLICASLLIALSSDAFAGEARKWVATGQRQAKQLPENERRAQLKAERQSDDVAGIRIAIPGFYSRKLSLKDGEYDLVDLPGLSMHASPGQPRLPMKKIPIRIPTGAKCKVRLVKRATAKVQGYSVDPTQHPPLDGGITFPKPPFVKDKAIYGANRLFPLSNVYNTQYVRIRNKSFLEVTISPFQFNPATGELVVSTELELEVLVTNRKDLKADSPTLPGEMIADRPGTTDLTADSQDAVDGTPPKYMVLLDDQFAGNALLADFVDWKKRKGYDVVQVLTSEIPAATGGAPTHDEVRDYMRALPAEDYPLFLLLIGDHRPDLGIQGFYFNTNSGGYSDLYISCRDDSDYYPDLFCGRLPAKTSTRLTAMLDKVLEMDRTPPSSAAMYDNVIVAGQIQDTNGDNKADRLFCETADCVATYFEQDTGGVDYSCVRAIVNPQGMTAAGTWNDTSGGLIWNQEAIGTRITDTFVSVAEARSRLNSTINAGVAIVQHRDHGMDSGWGDPNYTSSDINALTNGSLRPAVFSINCLTGRYNSGDNCFTRRWLIHPNGGAYVVFAAVDVSYSWHNDWLTHGFYTAHFDDYLSYQNTSTTPDWPKDLPPATYFTQGTGKRLGEILNFGKLYYAEHHYSTTTTFRLFHCFGDPESYMQVHQPQTLSLSHDSTINPGFKTVTVVCDAGTLVSLYSPALGVHQSSVATGSSVEFDIYTATAGTIHVTGSKYGSRPYEGSIDVVIPPGVSWIATSVPGIDVSTPLGSGTIPETFDVWNLGVNTLDYTISDNQGWLSCAPTSGTSTGELDTISVDIDISGLPEGVHTAEILISDPSSGNGSVTIPVSLEIQVAHLLCDSSLDFGDVLTATTDTASLILDNTGALATVITSIGIDSPFSCGASLPLTIPPGEDVALQIEMDPVAVQLYSGTLTLTSNAAEDPVTVSLTGRGRLGPEISINPTSYTVSVALGEVETRPMTITNTGDLNLDYSIQGARLYVPDSDAAGGPDTYGYLWVDSDETGGPTYVWDDISATGTRLSISDVDDGSDSVSLPFSFSFYGVDYTTAYVCSNGFVTLASADTEWSNMAIPSASGPPTLIAGFFDDLRPESGGDIYSLVASDSLTIQFEQVAYYSGSGTVTFQMVLHSSGVITFYYKELTGTLSSCTVGIQNDAGDDGLQIVYNSSYLTDSLAIRIDNPPEWLKVSQLSGTVPPGGSEILDVAMDATGTPPGIYDGQFNIAHNARNEASPMPVPCQMHVDTRPEVLSAAWADPSAITTAESTQLNVVATDAEGDTLTYTWSVESGPDTATITPNATELSDVATASFTTPGTYLMRVSVWDGWFDSTSDVTVNVLTLTDPEDPTGLFGGMSWKLYTGVWSALPDFNALVEDSSGVTDSIALGIGEPADDFGICFSGYLEVPTDGVYTFYTDSCDGSKLYIGATEVVDNDGTHAATEQSGTIALAAGMHPIRVVFFHGTGGASLSVSWEGPGITKEVVPTASLHTTNETSTDDDDSEESRFDCAHGNSGDPSGIALVVSAILVGLALRRRGFARV